MRGVCCCTSIVRRGLVFREEAPSLQPFCRLAPEEGDGVIERLFKRVEGTFDLQAASDH